ncbi:exported hypothetical protein [uncultured Pleomorphomonas sp.]|uniref:L,D-TPase catalytic domain-containing protein n=1 Tax=uncultured Pleomorphomonas sp. TaxID=442121 RepID=A0A212LGM0_9HYPH|nr:L,D-transpeptidase [uncultured Pleomorphomonas sp.]SCM76706.1 exported hypothetical protein [uncultured Pleomorphomonas sp.]
MVKLSAVPARPLMPALAAGLVLAACVATPPVEPPVVETPVVEAPVKPLSYLPDDTADDPRDFNLVGDQLPPEPFRRAEIDYPTDEPPGTVIIDTGEKHLYLVEEDGRALRYSVGVGREGFAWKGTVAIGSRQKWPRWFPPKEMIAREAARGHNIPEMMEGQIGNPLGARALYLYDGPKDTLFRIHGTFEPKSIGTNASSGCIRMANADVMDLYERVGVGTRVVVR